MPNEALDVETWPLRAGQKAARLVCVSFGTADRTPRLYHRENWLNGWLPELVYALRNADELRNQNLGFDIAVLINDCRRLLECGSISLAVFREIVKLVWELYAQDRARDTMVTAMLIAIMRGEPMTIEGRRKLKLHNFALDGLVEHYIGETVEGKHGPDVWRTNYWKLDAVPVCDWPQEAVDYSLNDPVLADRLLTSERDFLNGARPRSEMRNVSAAWCMMLAEAWGVRTDARYVRAFKLHLLRQRRDAFTTIRETIGTDGWLRPDGSRDMAKMEARVADAHTQIGIKPPQTPSGKVSCARENLERVADVAPDLAAYAKIGATKTELSTFVPRL